MNHGATDDSKPAAGRMNMDDPMFETGRGAPVVVAAATPRAGRRCPTTVQERCSRPRSLSSDGLPGRYRSRGIALRTVPLPRRCHHSLTSPLHPLGKSSAVYEVVYAGIVIKRSPEPLLDRAWRPSRLYSRPHRLSPLSSPLSSLDKRHQARYPSFPTVVCFASGGHGIRSDSTASLTSIVDADNSLPRRTPARARSSCSPRYRCSNTAYQPPRLAGNNLFFSV